MKRNVIATVLLLLVCTGSVAKRIEKVTGNPACLKEQVSAVVTMDFYDCSFNGKSSLKDEVVSEADIRRVEAMQGFITGFNTRKYLVATETADSLTKYELRLHFDNIDLRQVDGTAPWGVKALRFFGSMDIVDRDTGCSVYSVAINGYRSTNGYDDVSERTVHCFDSLGRRLSKKAKSK